MGAITRFLKNSSMYFFVTIIQKLVMLGLFAYIARVFTKAEMGQYSLALVCISIVGMCLCSFTQAGYQRFYFEHSGDNRVRFELSMLNLLLLSSFFGALLLYLLKPYFEHNLHDMSDVFFMLFTPCPMARSPYMTRFVFVRLNDHNFWF